MKFGILKHAFGLIARNIEMALRIALVPWLLMTVVTYTQNILVYGEVLVLPGMDPNPDQGVVIGLLPLLNFVVMIAVSIWILVGWHRFILRDEETYVYWPEWRGDVIMDYFVRAFFIWLVLSVLIVANVALGINFLGKEAFSPMYFDGSPIPYLVFTWAGSGLFVYVSLRISLGLPAISVEETMFIKESWRETKPFNREICGASIVLALAYMPLALITLNYSDVFVLVLIVQALGGLHVLLSASVLTTLYGVVKEGRELT